MVRVAIVLAAVALAWPTALRAESVCPVERTVLSVSMLHDGSGELLGGVRGGAVVKITGAVDPKDTDRVEVAIDEPFSLRAFGNRWALLVFAKEEIEISPGFMSFRKGTAFVVVSGPNDAERMRIAPFETHRRASWYRSASFETTCEKLVGVSPHALYEDECHGASIAWPRRSSTGERVLLKKATRDGVTLPIEVRSRNGKQSFETHTHNVHLLEENEGSGFVEMVEKEGLVLRGWIARARYERPPPIKPGHGRGGYGEVHLCCEASLTSHWQWHWRQAQHSGSAAFDGRSNRLRANAQLSKLEGQGLIMKLPAGAPVWTWFRENDRVQASFNWNENGVHRGEISGWVPATALEHSVAETPTMLSHPVDLGLACEALDVLWGSADSRREIEALLTCARGSREQISAQIRPLVWVSKGRRIRKEAIAGWRSCKVTSGFLAHPGRGWGSPWVRSTLDLNLTAEGDRLSVWLGPQATLPTPASARTCKPVESKLTVSGLQLQLAPVASDEEAAP